MMDAIPPAACGDLFVGVFPCEGADVGTGRDEVEDDILGAGDKIVIAEVVVAAATVLLARVTRSTAN